MSSSGFQGDYLSATTKVYYMHQPQFQHFTRYCLYTMLATVAPIPRSFLKESFPFFQVKRGRGFYLIFFRHFLVSTQSCVGLLLFATAGTRMAMCKIGSALFKPSLPPLSRIYIQHLQIGQNGLFRI